MSSDGRTRQLAVVLSAAGKVLIRLAREGLSSQAPKHVRLAAGALDKALDDMAALLAERFVHMDSADRDAVFRAFARDQTIHVA